MKARLNEVTKIDVGDLMFHARKFRALTAARISSDVIALVSPLLGGAGPLLDAWGGSDADSENGSNDVALLDQDFGAFLPALSGGLAQLDGRRVEAVLKELLIDEGCISYEGDALTQSVLDELFCGDLMGLLKLALEIIKLNFGSLFTMLGFQSGSRADTTASLI
jgi:hypothetical protein